MVKRRKSPLSRSDSNNRSTSGWKSAAWTEHIVIICNGLEGVDLQLIPSAYKAFEAMLGVGPMALSQLSLAQAIAQCAAGPIWGYIADNSARLNVLALGMFFWGIIAILFSMANTFTEMLILRAFAGVFLASISPTCQSLVADMYPEDSRGKAYGQIQLVLCLGMMIGAIASTSLSRKIFFDVIQGWRIVFLVVGCVAILASLVIVIVGVDPPRGAFEKQAVSSILQKSQSSVSSKVQAAKFSIMNGDEGLTGSDEDELEEPEQEIEHHSHSPVQPISGAITPGGIPSHTIIAKRMLRERVKEEEEDTTEENMTEIKHRDDHQLSIMEMAKLQNSNKLDRESEDGEEVDDDEFEHHIMNQSIEMRPGSSGSAIIMNRPTEQQSENDSSLLNGCLKGLDRFNPCNPAFCDNVRNSVPRPTLVVLLLEGTLGYIPLSAFSFCTFYFQYIGFADVFASALTATILVGGALGGLFGGYFGDIAGKVHPHWGRPLVGFSSCFLAAPVMAAGLHGIPRTTESFFMFLGTMLLLGFVSSWCAPGVNRPVLAELVPARRRAQVFATLVAIEGAVASCLGGPAVGFLAEALYGYKVVGGGGSHGEDSALVSPSNGVDTLVNANGIVVGVDEQTTKNISALANALTVATCMPWLICALLYLVLRYTFERDKRNMVRDARGGIYKPVYQPLSEGRRGESRFWASKNIVGRLNR